MLDPLQLYTVYNYAYRTRYYKPAYYAPTYRTYTYSYNSYNYHAPSRPMTPAEQIITLIIVLVILFLFAIGKCREGNYVECEDGYVEVVESGYPQGHTGQVIIEQYGNGPPPPGYDGYQQYQPDPYMQQPPMDPYMQQQMGPPGIVEQFDGPPPEM